MMERRRLIELLDHFHDKYNQRGFIQGDPVSIPHSFTRLQDVEIMGFFAAVFAWGQRITTINKCLEVARMMDGRPYEFILSHRATDLIPMQKFTHRTFNGTDLLYFISFFNWYYKEHESLEEAFLGPDGTGSADIREALAHFHHLFFSLEHVPARTRKHVADAGKNAPCKRLNMFLRWMARKDDRGVDLGIWKRISPASLACPLDVHVERSARMLGLVTRKQRDWKTVEELTLNLRKIDPCDPVKYDFALFGMGLEHFRP